MKGHLNFILSSALLVVAASLAIFTSTRPASPATAESRATSVSSERSTRADHRQNSQAPKRRAGTPSSLLALGVTVDPSVPDHPRLAQLAKQVERHAYESLARMTRELDLSPDQQRRIFPKLVAASESFHPAMRIVGAGPAPFAGAPGTPLDGDLDHELDPLQQDKLTESHLDDLLLWKEIIANLERQLESQTPDPTPLPETPEPAEVPSNGGRNVFDLIPTEPR